MSACLPEHIIDGQDTSEDAEHEKSAKYGHDICKEDPTFPYPGNVPLQPSLGWDERARPHTDLNTAKIVSPFNFERLTRSFGASCNVSRGPGARSCRHVLRQHLLALILRMPY
jgi:hypothetical protein